MSARAAFWTAAGVFAAALGWAWSVLPERVPVHWSNSAGPDRVVERGRAVLEMGAIGLALMLLFAGLALWMPRMPWTLVNVPHKEYWQRPENRQRAVRMLAADSWGMGAACLAFLVVVLLQIVLAADDPDPRIGAPFWISFGIFTAGVLGYAVLGVRRRFRPEDDPAEVGV